MPDVHQVGVIHDQTRPRLQVSWRSAPSLDVVEQIAKLKWNCRIGFAMRGEPSLHPDAPGMIAEVRKHLPKAHITVLTNGGGLLRKPGPTANIEAFFDAGLNVLGMDHYTNVAFVPKIIETLQKDMGIVQMKSGDTYGEFQFFKYPEDRRGNPHVRRPRNSRTLVQIRDIMAQNEENKTGTHSKVLSYAGRLRSTRTTAMMGSDAVIQLEADRGHHHDGNIRISAAISWNAPYNDREHTLISLGEVWQSDTLGAARETGDPGQRDTSRARAATVIVVPDRLMLRTCLARARSQALMSRLRRISEGAEGRRASPIIHKQPWMK